MSNNQTSNTNSNKKSIKKKAVILNSGLGSRLGTLTETQPKCMMPLTAESTVLSKQLFDMAEAGIEEFVITTGPFPGLIEEYISKINFPHKVTYVENSIYASTNYIYSLYLAREEIKDAVMMAHGDIVTTAAVYKKILDSEAENTVVIDTTLPEPEKDFKGKVENGRVHAVSVKISGENCIALQPVYKLSNILMNAWLDKMSEFVNAGTTGVYAENALNEILDKHLLVPCDLKGQMCMEVDTPEDLAVAQKLLLK